ncbi:hypothetical protein [Pedobacter sp.]|uniref:hypothetical protein n=1 Tax=Pedobacter sp. TaxID=1411316 RepID=UPI003BAC91DB
MFEDYKLEVRNSYLEMKASYLLSDNLQRLTRARLRRECLNKFSKRTSKINDRTVQAFFDPLNQYNDAIRSIEKFDLEKFRPLESFLVKGTSIRDEEPVKLLAWLIDFESYDDWKERKLKLEADENEDVTELTEAGENQTDPSQDPPVVVVVLGQEDAAANEVDVLIDKGGKPEEEIIEPDTSTGTSVLTDTVKSSISLKWVLFGSIVVLLIGGAASLLWENILDRPTPTPDKCMYWAGEYYKGIACDKNNNISTPVVQMDRNKLMHLTKITVPDTLTKNAIGKVWYSNIKGHHEFFSDSGMHPVDTAKRLRPLTAYILFKYTSYHRYQLTRLVWGISIISVIVLLVVLIRKEVKKKSLTAV